MRIFCLQTGEYKDASNKAKQANDASDFPVAIIVLSSSSFSCMPGLAQTCPDLPRLAQTCPDFPRLAQTGKLINWVEKLHFLSLSRCIKDGLTDQQTDRFSYRNVRMYLRHSYNVIVDLWFIILNHFGVNPFISIGFTR